MTCSRCGATTGIDATTCARCGAPLATTEATTRAVTGGALASHGDPEFESMRGQR